jgi:ATP-binding cassette subfamily F protein uup
LKPSSAAAPLLSAHNLHKSFGARPVLNDVSVTLSATERAGLVGDNGSGKSTLAKVLAGVEAPDRGEVMRQRGARIAFLDQVPVFDPERSAFDTVAEGQPEWQATQRAYEDTAQRLARTQDASAKEQLLHRQAELGVKLEHLGGWEQEHKIRHLLEHLSVPDPSAPMRQLSGGEQRRVALAQQLLAAPDLLILDEPTNHLDTETIDWLEEYLTETYRGALLLITHDRYVLDRVVNRTLELSAGSLASYAGGWQQYLEGKAERAALEQRTESNRQNFLRSELEWLRRQPKARGTKQKARIERASEALDGAPASKSGGVQLSLSAERQGSSVLAFQGLGLELAGRTLIDELSFILGKRQRVGILGANGMGKTSLLRLAIGDLQPTRGEVIRGKNTRITYFDQTRSGLDDSKSIQENVTDAPRVRFGGQELTLYSYLDRFAFRSEDLVKKVGMLSGGERARVALAKLLLQDTNLLLLDEPTNDLDTDTLAALEDLLDSWAGTLVVVSHDRYLLERVCDTIVAIVPGGPSGLAAPGEQAGGTLAALPGGVDEYLARRAAVAAPQATLTDSDRRERKGDTRAARKELARIERRIATLEKREAQLHAELAEHATDYGRVASLDAELRAAITEREQLEESWLELSLTIE